MDHPQAVLAVAGCVAYFALVLALLCFVGRR